MTVTATTADVLKTPYQRSIADYWDKEKDPVNIRLGEVDGLYHHHYGIGPVDESVRGGTDEQIIAELHRLETDQADFLIDHLGDLTPTDRVLDAGSGRGGSSIMVNQRFGCQVDGVSISQQQVDFANGQAQQRGVADQVRFHFKNMLHTGIEDGSLSAIWTNETTMYVDLFELFGEFSRMLKFGGRYVCITGCWNDLTGGRSKAVIQIDERYTCNVHPRSEYFRALAAHGLAPISVFDLTPATIPYWELRETSCVATGVEVPFLQAYRESSFHYLMIVADKVRP
ncbi:methyltransferase domain-containing protein [Pseudonocardiaceae bacterium YIM PH 21723]|nr:methyltransferase domain-containing protein [Pseudonocardiaceae bacterium YIM PH 21723]